MVDLRSSVFYALKYRGKHSRREFSARAFQHDDLGLIYSFSSAAGPAVPREKVPSVGLREIAQLCRYLRHENRAVLAC